MDFKGYPRCNNGDVLIMLSPDKSFQLHSAILRRHSSFFRKHLNDGGATLSPAAKRNGEHVRWRFDMVQRPAEGEDGAGLFERVDLDSMARPLPHSRLVYSDFTQTNTGPPALFNHYDKVFGTMYSIQFDLDSSNATIQELLQDVVGIIDVSKYLGCMHAVSNTINAALLGQGQVLWRSVQANPFAWVDLALRVRSVAVFAEAIIHLVGRWNALSFDEVAGLDPVVRKFCEQKREELRLRCIQVECRIAKFYPPEITRSMGAPPKDTQRMSYANDIYTWMALCLHRHWFTSHTCVGMSWHNKDGGYRFYRTLWKAGDNYLDKTEVNKFHDKFPMSTRGEHVLDQTVNRIKEMIRPLLTEIMRSEANLDHERFPVEYLTCTFVRKEEVQALFDSLDGGNQAVIGWGEGGYSTSKRKGQDEAQLRHLEQQLSCEDGGYKGLQMALAKRRKISGSNEDVESEGESGMYTEDEDEDEMEGANGCV